MTNIRITTCEKHGCEQFNNCVTCGAPLKVERLPSGELYKTCGRDANHVKIWGMPCRDIENCMGRIKVE